MREMQRVIWVNAVDFNTASFELGIMIRCHHFDSGSNGAERPKIRYSKTVQLLA